MKLHKVTQNTILASSVLLAITSTVGLAGCGSGDPTKKYAVSKEAVAPDKVLADAGAVKEGGYLFHIDSNSQYMYFTEGQSDTYYFRPTLLVEGVQYSILQAGLPTDQGISVTKATDKDHAGMIAISWTPKIGTLGNESSRPYKFMLTLQPAANTDQRASTILSQINLTQSFEFRLVKSDDVPTIQKIDTTALASVQEGQRKVFSVTVQDLGASADRQPSLIAVADQTMTVSGDVPKFNAEPNVFVRGEAQNLGNGLFKFEVYFDGTNMTMPAGATSAKAHFIFRVDSATGRESTDQVVEFNVTRKPNSNSNNGGGK